MSESSESDSVINLQEALLYTAGDPDMLTSMAELLLVEGPTQLQSIETHIRSGDLSGIRKAAHSLKGSIAIFAAREAVDAALELERVSTDEEAALIPAAWTTLNHEMKRLLDDAQKLCKPPAQ